MIDKEKSIESKLLISTVALVAVTYGIFSFVEYSWFIPAREGQAAQIKLDDLFAEHEWEGYAGAWHYDHRVRFDSTDVGDDEVKLLYPIMHELNWLNHIELKAPSMTDQGIAELKKNFRSVWFECWMSKVVEDS